MRHRSANGWQRCRFGGDGLVLIFGAAVDDEIALGGLHGAPLSFVAFSNMNADGHDEAVGAQNKYAGPVLDAKPVFGDGVGVGIAGDG